MTDESLQTIKGLIPKAVRADRRRFGQQLDRIERAMARNRPQDRNLSRLQAEVESSVALRQKRLAGRPKVDLTGDLPVLAHVDELTAAIETHQVVIVCGETGSGKSTQLPKLCLRMGRGIDGLIGHTQPRRIAARSVAARVAEELGTQLGRQVGFQVRFTDTTGPETYLKLMTDGILLAELRGDKFLNRYDTIILDEAHERSLNIDFLLGAIRQLLPRRPEFRLIVTSATIDAQRFSDYFSAGLGGVAVPVFEVSGRNFPVEMRYRPPEELEKSDEPEIFRDVFLAVDELAGEGFGDTLIFVPTERDIHELARGLRGHLARTGRAGRYDLLPLYARLPAAEQQRVFHPQGGQTRIVIATNVAESSLTVPGIRYVIDTGVARISRYSPRSQVLRLPIEPISKASARQRAGRCGRIGPGICIRLFSEEDFNGREEYTPPEILRTNLAAVVLKCLNENLGDIEDFPFLDPPRPTAIRDAYQTLFELGAVGENHKLTPLGRTLAKMPIDPRLGRIVLAGHDESCLAEILILVAGMEIQDPRERPIEKQQAADEAHAMFADESSDVLSLLKIWDFYHQLRDDLSRNRLRAACRQKFLSEHRLREWSELYRQLRQVVEETGLKIGRRRNNAAAIHRAVLTGYLSRIAPRDAETGEYQLATGQRAVLWPGSGVAPSPPKWLVAAEIVETRRRYIRTIARIDPGWIERLAGHLLKTTTSGPEWDAEQGTAITYERVSLLSLPIIPRRRRRLWGVDPATARQLFIERGLVAGEMDCEAPFHVANRKLMEDLHDWQVRQRKFDLIRPDDEIAAWFEERLPPGVHDRDSLMRRLRKGKAGEFDRLRLSRADLLREDEPGLDPQKFPDTLEMGASQYRLEYCFDPGEANDGVTMVVPQQALNQVDAARLEWLVPGLVEEKIAMLIRSLPKDLRRQLVPVPDTARDVAGRMSFNGGTLLSSLAAELSKIAGEPIEPQHFQKDRRPDNLRMNLRVVNEDGETVGEGRDLSELRQRFGAAAAKTFAAQAESQWHRDGLRTWDLDEFPAEVPFRRDGIRLVGYPALIDKGDAVSLRLLDDKIRALHETRAGVRRLFCLKFQRQLKSQTEWIPHWNTWQLQGATLSAPLRSSVLELIADRALFNPPSIPRGKSEFEQLCNDARERSTEAVQDVVKLLNPMLANYHETKLALENLPRSTPRPAVAELQMQLAELVEPGFLTTAAWGWLLQYPRYFQAMRERMRKLSATQGTPAEDEVLRWAAAYRARRDAHRRRGVIDPALIQFRWLLEEYRVSVFAQRLGTAVPVSPQRLSKAWAATVE